MMNYPGPMYPPPPPPASRRWPLAVGGAASGAVITALVAALIAGQRQAEPATKPTAPATVTVTATPAPPIPVPLPTAEADRRTCDAWHASGEKMHAATRAQSVIPKELNVLSPQVRDNPDWTAAVRDAADFYRQAADTLHAGIAAGTTVILGQAALSTVDALRTLSTGYATFDAAGGNAYHVMHEASDEVDVLCERLAPR